MARASNHLRPAGTSCKRCASSNQEEFIVGLENLDRPGVLVPKVLVCLDCGLARFTTPEDALAELAQGRSNEDD
jgi:hypothetical protein